MAYAGSKRSKDDFSGGGDDEVQEKQPPSKVARTWPRAEDAAGESITSAASYGNVEHWMRMQQVPKAAAADMAAASNALNFQQRVMAAAALQEIRSIDPSRQMFQQPQLHPPSSFKFQSCQQQLDSALLEHQLPPASPMRMQSNLRPSQVFGEFDSSNLGMVSSSSYLPVVSRPTQTPHMGSGSSMPLLCDIGAGDYATSSSSSRLCGGGSLPQQNGILQQMQQKNGMLQQQQQLLTPILPMPPAPGFLGRDHPPSWFPSIKDAPLPPSFPDMMPSLSGIPPMPISSSFGLGSEFLDQSQLQMPLQIPMHQHQQQASSSSMSYGGGDVLSSNGFCGAPATALMNYGTAACSSSSQGGNLHPRQSASCMTKMLNQCNNTQASRHLAVAAPAAAAAAAAAGGGSSYCSSELAASSVTSVHNAAAAASSSASMQNGSPEDSPPIQRSFPPVATTTTTTTTNQQQHKQPPTRTYTKVYKLGSIGRAVDVTRFNNYTELRWELARMFGLEGQLDQKSGWQLVFIDHEGDILLVGDDPWEEFVTSVRGIRILSPSEVAFYTNNDTDKAGSADAGAGAAHSCLTSGF